MRLSMALVTEFQELYQKKFGEVVSPEVAELELLSLAELIRITHPPTENETSDGEEHEIKSKSRSLPN